MSNRNNNIIQKIFQSYLPQLKNKKLPLKDQKAITAITACRTPEMGYQYLSCPKGHEDKINSHSCRHRSCSICSNKGRHEWIESEKERLINCPHYHVVFTLPHEYINLWQYNRKWFTKTFFKACRNTLIELLEDDRYLGATPGILMTLHTWGRQMNMHPHIHCLITAGGLSSDEWKATHNNYLLPIKVVKALFRGKMQAYIKQAYLEDMLRLPLNTTPHEFNQMHRSLYKKEWSIRIQEQYKHGRGVVLYLAKYMKGGPINPKQILSCDYQNTTFAYKDHHTGNIKTLKIATQELIRRILWHVPEIGVHVVRHYGLYASKKQKSRQRCKDLLGIDDTFSKNTRVTAKDELHWCCRICGNVMNHLYTVFKAYRDENSYIKESSLRRVQQNVQVDAVCWIGPDG